MKLKVFETEIDFEYKFDPNICELSLLCEDKSGQIYTFNEIEHEISNMNFRKYNLIFQKKIIKKSGMIEKTIKKYPFDNVKKWFGIFCEDPKLFPINTPINEISLYFNFSEYLKFNERDLSEQEITEIIDLINKKFKLQNFRRIYEFYSIINQGYLKFIDKIVPKDCIKIGKYMIKRNKIDIELFKKIRIGGQNQIIWIIKNKLYPLLNISSFSKKIWIEAKDIIVRNIHRILPFIDKNTFDIMEPIVEWEEYKERNPDVLIKGSRFGCNFRIIPKYFNCNTDQEVMKEIYKKFYLSNPDNYDIFEAQSNFCYYILRMDKTINNISDVRKKIELWKKVEYAIS